MPAPGRAAILVLLSIALAACAGKPPPRPREVRAPVLREVPSALRGTVGSEATLGRATAVLVSGYGLVVGLPGTGGGDLDERIAATMERQLGLMGISKANPELVGTVFEGMTPRQILRSRDVAVVTVYSAVVPGAPKEATFDVYVSAVSPNPDVSLEGGLLWTTDLQIGPPTPHTGYQKTRIGTAYGPIFINPFAQQAGPAGYARNTGRILGGGTITDPLPLQLILDNESHQRSRAMTRSINERFPAAPGAPPTARGRNDRIVEISVPRAYADRASEFLNLLIHIQIDSSIPQEYAQRYITTLKEEPYLSDDMRWCLQALPQKSSLPFLRSVYDHPEQRVRLAALRAGAGLNDALAAPHLKALAREGPPEQRIEAIELLGRLSAGPTVDVALQEQLEASELSIRVAAYEALAGRAEQAQMQRVRDYQQSLPAAARVTLQAHRIDPRRQLALPGDSLQGVKRIIIEKEKFLLDIVPRGENLVYVTQSGRPRVVLFGKSLALHKPLLASVWDNRLMIAADTPTDDFRILYRTPDRLTVEGETIPGRMVTGKAPGDLPALVEFLAHTPSPEDPRPGLGMTYSEVVGALSALHERGAFPADFAVETDVLQARLREATQAPEGEDRPETKLEAEQREKVRIFPQPKAGEAETPAKPAETPSMVVPLPPPAAKKK